MQATGDFGRDRGINQPLALDTRETAERRRHDPDTEMGFAPFPRAAVAGMAGAFILDSEGNRRESGLKLLPQCVRHWS